MAANRLKGITIEIDGNTTKLDKALEGTKKQINSTKSSLKDVERLLKLDPGNTTLLEQKQRLLASAVSGTADKLKTLKEAAAQADDALERGTAYEEKYAPLKQSIEEASGQLKNLKAQQEEMAAALAAGTISDEQYKALGEAISATEEHLAALKDEKKALDDEFKGDKLSQEQFDALQREIVETENDLKNLEKQSAKSNVALESIGAKAEEVAGKTKKLSIAAGGVAVGLIGMAAKAGLAADDLNTLSKQSGFSTDTIQRWQYASDLIDVSIDDIVGAARKMEKNMSSTSSDVTAAWERLGISVRDGSGSFRDAEEVFDEVVERLSQIPSETDRDVLAMQIFGKSANDLAGIIDDGGAALRELGQEAQDAGLILSQDALDGANQFNDALDKMKATITADMLKAGTALAEALTPVMDSLSKLVITLANGFGNLSPGMQKMILYAALLLAGISPIAKTVSSITGEIQGVTAVGKIFSATAGNAVYATFLKWVGVILLVVAAVTALLAVISVLMGKGQELQGTMNSITSSTSATMGGLNKGNLNTAAQNMGQQAVPGFASGGVFAPNSPMLAVLGDNRQEYEVAAPESMLRSVFSDVLDAKGSQSGSGAMFRQPVNLSISIDGRTFARLFLPYLSSEQVRVGTAVTGGGIV